METSLAFTKKIKQTETAIYSANTNEIGTKALSHITKITFYKTSVTLKLLQQSTMYSKVYREGGKIFFNITET